jgi:hypothetical protein
VEESRGHGDKTVLLINIFLYWRKTPFCPTEQLLTLYTKVGLYFVEKTKVPVPARNITSIIQFVDEGLNCTLTLGLNVKSMPSPLQAMEVYKVMRRPGSHLV